MSGYDLDYSQRRVRVQKVAGLDKSGKSHVFFDVDCILNMTNDRLTSITVLERGSLRAAARLPKKHLIVQGTAGIQNLALGYRLSAVENMNGSL